MYKAYKEHLAKHGQSKEDKTHKYKLYYFDMRGRAETIRLIFAQAGVDYEDCRFTHSEWPELKPKMPWGTVPVLEVDGYMLGQSRVICRYLATELGLSGCDDFEKAIVDSIGEIVTEILEKFGPAFIEKDQEKKMELVKTYTEQTLPAILGSLNEVLGENDYFFGDKVTWVDLHFYACTEGMPKIGFPLADVFMDFPNLLALFYRVEKLPNIANWIENRPATDY